MACLLLTGRCKVMTGRRFSDTSLEPPVRSLQESRKPVLTWLIQHTSARCMRWIVSIITKDLKARRGLTCIGPVARSGQASHPVLSCTEPSSAAQIGVSVDSAMKWLHPDAIDMWKMTMTLSDVVRACADPSKRLPRQVHRRSNCSLEQHVHKW